MDLALYYIILASHESDYFDRYFEAFKTSSGFAMSTCLKT